MYAQFVPTGNVEVGDAMGDMYEANIFVCCENCDSHVMGPPVWLPVEKQPVDHSVCGGSGICDYCRQMAGQGARVREAGIEPA